MIEPTVQVPVSLIERIGDHVAREYEGDPALDAMVLEVRALLSQPTPTAVDRIQADLFAIAEPMESGELRSSLLNIAEGDYSQPTPTAEPHECDNCLGVDPNSCLFNSARPTAEPPRIEQIRAELGGHDLACWCPLDQPCHADVLLELANGGADGG